MKSKILNMDGSFSGLVLDTDPIEYDGMNYEDLLDSSLDYSQEGEIDG